MRRLLLLRHAKSDWSKGTPDLERPLAPRGREAAPRMGGYLKGEGLLPDLVLVSPAKRARETFEAVRPFLEDSRQVVEPRIYGASAGQLLAVVRDADPAARSLMMIGHNPGFEDLAKLLIGSGDRYARARLVEKYPTAGLAIVDFPDEDWAAAAPGTGRLDRFVTPKSLGADEDD
jgi:phosphohistidine phosphatase